MPRLNNIDQVLFPVEEYPIVAVVRTRGGEKTLPAPGKKAIVDCTHGRVLGVVSRGYRLVSNQEALDMAVQCCRHVFPETRDSEWEIKATEAPATGGHCFIDLAHNSTALDFSAVSATERPDVFGPFIRVTNSYNGRRALAFDIGFYRKVCQNGMILPGSIIQFKFTHRRQVIGETIRFETSHDQLAKMKSSFESFIGVLKRYAIDRQMFEPLTRAVLMIQEPKTAARRPREAADWKKLNIIIGEMCDRYSNELGENAYAVFNAITEFASNPPVNRCVYRERHSFQRSAGSWMTAFSSECTHPGFDLQAHIASMSRNSEAPS